MEILKPDILRIALNVALVLSAMSAVVLAVIIGVRLRAQAEARRMANLRREAEPLVAAYLAGREKPAAIVDLLQKHPEQSLLLLMEISDRLEPAARAPLQPLFASLPLREKETKALWSRHWERRLQAAERLGYLGEEIALPALLDALQDPVLAVRFAAARSLGTNYSRLIAALRGANIALDRKILADLAVRDFEGFKSVLSNAGISLKPNAFLA